MENSIKITPLQWYAGVAEDMRNKLFLKIIAPREYYEKLTEALKTAMEQEKQQIIDASASAYEDMFGANGNEYGENYYNKKFNN